MCFNSRISILQGASGGGKTYLLGNLGALDAPITASDGTRVDVIAATGSPQRRVVEQLQDKQNCVFVFDEDDMMLYDEALVKYLQTTPNYLLIMARDSFSWLPYGLGYVFVLEGTPKHSRMVPRYKLRPFDPQGVSCVVCEGEGLDFRVVKQKLASVHIDVVSARGKNNVYSVAQSQKQKCAIIVDWCGIGSAVHELCYLSATGKVTAVPSESFECELLSSEKLLGDAAGVTEAAYSMLLNKEQYYTDLLNSIMLDVFGLGYSKASEGACADLVCTGAGQCNRQVVKARGFKPYTLDEVYSELDALSGNGRTTLVNQPSGIPKTTLE